MTHSDMPGRVDLERALDDPAGVFDGPEAVADHPALTLAQKTEILRRWEYDAVEAVVATEEGMKDGDTDLLSRILRSLDRVTDGYDVEHVAPTKQHGLPKG
jgi:hypothetical protein